VNGIRILGVDPGSRITGFGVIEHSPRGSRAVAWGDIRAEGEALPERLRSLFDQLSEVVRAHAPQEVAVERVFVHKSVDSALKLGQARGAALCAVFSAGAPVFEYAPREIKQAVVGHGGAEKRQVQHMIQVLLAMQELPRSDAADALAIALCHAHRRSVPALLRTGRRR
jgi:crossover junction endodeoxyribonuclease RuvC